MVSRTRPLPHTSRTEGKGHLSLLVACRAAQNKRNHSTAVWGFSSPLPRQQLPVDTTLPSINIVCAFDNCGTRECSEFDGNARHSSRKLLMFTCVASDHTLTARALNHATVPHIMRVHRQTRCLGPYNPGGVCSPFSHMHVPPHPSRRNQWHLEVPPLYWTYFAHLIKRGCIKNQKTVPYLLLFEGGRGTGVQQPTHCTHMSGQPWRPQSPIQRHVTPHKPCKF